MIWFVENLSLGVWARLLLPRMMRSGRAQGCDRVFWIDSSRAGTLVGPLLGALVDARVERLDFRLIDLHDENGLLLQLRLAFEDLFGVQEAAISEPAFAFALRDAAGKGRLGSFLKKAPVVISLEHRTLWRALYLLYVADWKRREMRAQRTEACIVLEDQAWLESLDETAARLQILIDVEGYRARRNETIRTMAHRTAVEAQQEKKRQRASATGGPEPEPHGGRRTAERSAAPRSAGGPAEAENQTRARHRDEV